MCKGTKTEANHKINEIIFFWKITEAYKALQRCSVAVPKTLLPNLPESSILYYIYY